MKCEPTQTPAPGEIDIAAIRQRYREERDTRLRPEGQEQYVKTQDDYAASYEADPHMPVRPRPPIFEDLDVAILGAGISGIMAGVHLRNAAVANFRHIEHAGDFGGVWYWNRYPGIQCDNDAYCYMPLLEETGFVPSKKFADGHEIQEHCQRIANKYGLYPNALFHTLITALRWDESIRRWRISTNRNDDIRARFVIMCGGPLNRPKLPGIPGIGNFKRRLFHTARWEYEYSGGSWKHPVLDKLGDQRVAIVGTGASAVQAIPYLGRYAKQLYVLQRTPSSVDKRPNPPTPPEWVSTLKPGWQKERQAHFHRAAVERLIPGETDLICDIWTEINRNLSVKLHAQGSPELTIQEYSAMREVEDFLVMERMRRRVDSIVKDGATAEALKPWYRFLCKRPCSNDEYYETYNRPNVKLIDVSRTQGVERMTEKGFVAQGREYEIDCLICASGFEVTSDLDRRWGIGVVEGRNGVSLYDHWADGYRTLHGAMTHGFPNQFFTGYLQGGFTATTTEQFSRQGYHIAYIVSEALRRGLKVVEPSEAAQDDWVRTLRATAFDLTKFQRECTPSYFNNEGSQKIRWYLGESYGLGWVAFEQLMQQWRDSGNLEGLVLEADD
jgi:cyclohexanone monooxygenase